MALFGKSDLPETGSRLYALFDRVVGEYMSPIPAANDASAVRMVRDTLKAQGQRPSPLQANPGDHALFCLGSYDPKTGRIHAYPQPEIVVQVASLVELPPQ